MRTCSVVGIDTWASPMVTFARVTRDTQPLSSTDAAGASWITPVNPLHLEDLPTVKLDVQRREMAVSTPDRSSKQMAAEELPDLLGEDFVDLETDLQFPVEMSYSPSFEDLAVDSDYFPQPQTSS